MMNIIREMFSFFEKLFLNFEILLLLLKKQFFFKNKFLFIFLPVIISFFVIKFNLFKQVLDKDQISLMVTIISLFGGILLNFLVLILTDKKSILWEQGRSQIYGTINGKHSGKVDEAGLSVDIEVNYFEFLYYKIFFIIIMSMGYLAFFMLYQFGLFTSILGLIKENGAIIIPYFQLKFETISLFYFSYVYFLIFYFLNLFFLVLKLYYLLQRKKGIIYESN